MNNCFLLVGKTGVGKSTLTKILSGDQSIRTSSSLESETKESKCYLCQINNFNYSLIDTPGYDSSDGKDKIYSDDLKNKLTSHNYHIKGIVLMFNFHDKKLGKSHKIGLENIVDLVPLDNFWDYVIIVFTHTFHSNLKKLEKEKKERLKA